MIKMAKYAFLLGPLMLGGCDEIFVPDGPPAPALPSKPASPSVPSMSTDDIPALQGMNERAIFMQNAASLAATHSERDIVKQFAVQLNDIYKQHQTAITQLLQPTHLTLPSTMAQTDQQRLTRLSRLYGRTFDRAFLRAVAVPFAVNDRQRIDRVQKNGSTDALKKLAGTALQSEQQQRQKAQDLIGY